MKHKAKNSGPATDPTLAPLLSGAEEAVLLPDAPQAEVPKLAFEMRRLEVSLERILPSRIVKNHDSLRRYKAIVASMREVGMVEPLILHPIREKPDTYLLVDGHLRLLALKQLGKLTAECLLAKDDEGFTYNARINRLPPIQCHKMIVKAVRNGVNPERIASALNMPIDVVRGLMTLLDGINGEAAELLKDKNTSPRTIRLLKRVTGLRQIEIAELMVSTNSYVFGYAEALVLGTPKDQLVNPAVPKKKTGLSAEGVAKLEREMESLERDFKGIETTYTANMMSLTLARSYLRKLMANGKVVRFLKAHHADLCAEFETIAAAEAV
jgi:hypothetical protein